MVRYGIPLAMLTAVCVGCSGPQAEGVPLELSAAIEAFYEAVEAGDTEAHIALFSEDAIMMPNHWTRLEGKATIAQVIRDGAGSVFRLRDREIIDMAVSGGLAYTVNSYYYTYHEADGEPQWHKTKNVHVWKRDEEGHWKLHVDIWNSDVPIDSFSNE